MPTVDLHWFMAQQARLFGPAELLVAGEWRPLPLDKRGGLLAVLARADGPVPRPRLARLFWSDALPGQGRTNLRGLLARVRSTGLPVDMANDADTLAWHATTDVSAFEAALGRSDWLAAAELNRGTFIADLEVDDAPEFSAWLELERRRFEDDRKLAVTLAAEELAQAGSVGHAAKLLRDARRRDPLDESVVQAFLSLAQLEAGLAPEALRDLEMFTTLLADELGLEPELHTLAMARTLRRLAGNTSVEALPATRPRRSFEHRGRLPYPVAPTIRRDAEAAEVAALLVDPGCRWVTLIGPGGIGKTSLALQVAHEAQSRFADGAAWFAFAGVRDLAYVPVVLASGLAMPLEGTADVLERLLNRLRGSEALLVLDDLDGVPDCGGLITDLLNACPHVKILATSRSALSVGSETVVAVHGLSYPTDAGDAAAEGYAAIRLFVLRARQVRGDYRLTEQETPAIVEICRLVEGSPLGIELAAGRTAGASVHEVVDLLKHDAGSVVLDNRNRPIRHRSLQASFEHVWQDLKQEDRRAVAALAVFRGPFDVEAALAVTAVRHESLVALLDRSLLKRDDAGHFGFHALVRQFAADELRRMPDVESVVLENHARYFASEVERLGGWLRGGELQASAVQELVLHLDDIHAAWERVRNIGDEQVLASFLPMLHVYEIRGLYELGETMFAAMADALPARSSTRARALTASSILAGRAEHLGSSRRAVDESLAIWASLEEDDPLTRLHLGVLSWLENDRVGAETAWSRSRTLAENAGDAWCRLGATGNLGVLALHLGDLDKAEELLLEAHHGAESLRDGWGSSFAEVNLGNLALARGNKAAARARFSAGLEIARGLGQARIVMEAQSVLAELAEADGRHEEAARRRQELEETATRFGLTVR